MSGRQERATAAAFGDRSEEIWPAGPRLSPGPFLLSLLTEQVGGYYEPKDKTVYLLDWLAPEQQKPVLAHELTHALQDQHVNLQKWSEVTHYDVAKNAVEDNVHIQTDEAGHGARGRAGRQGDGGLCRLRPEGRAQDAAHRP